MSAPRRLDRGLCLLAIVCLALPALAAVSPPSGPPARIAKDQVTSPPEPVEPWDAASPQRLVRIEGAVYQDDAGFYYRAIDDVITVRLAAGVADWSGLVARAKADDPQVFGMLDALVPGRPNKLGILDLRVPQGDVAEWSALVYRTGLVRYAEIATHGVYTVTPNDPLYPDQWALNNTGQTGGTPGADIGADEAWTITAGDPAIIVAILDSGTDVDHQDLAANVWHNPGEIPDNAVDDDGNGYVDDWEGWDFDNNDNDPRSGYFHGTHVTGIINAAGDNGLGVAGLAGGLAGPGVQGMALGVGEFGPDGSVLDDAIIYAADNGARVITLSLSVGSTSAINDALAYAYDTKDVFIDCAAGNNGASVSYPASRSEVMAVASTDHNDNHSSFSNPGPEVEVAAPGSSVLSTQIGNTYDTSSGTSFAAPYVAGLAGLVLSLNPGLPAADLRQLIIDSADDVASPGFDQQTGYGRINAVTALSLAAVSDGIVRLDSDRYTCDDVLTATVTDIDLAGSVTLAITLASSSEPAGETVVLTETGAGSGVFRGTIATENAAVLADGTLQVAHADTLSAEYLDADDGDGNLDVLKTASATTDCAGPGFSSITVAGIDDTSATITWSTDEAGDSLVRYGVSPPPTDEVYSGAPTTTHALQLDGLQPCTVYRFELESTDDLGNTGRDDNGGTYHGFETYGNFPGVGVEPCHQGQAVTGRSAYECTDAVDVSVTDIDLGLDPQAAETIQVLMTSTTETAGEWITLTEDALESSRFAGSIAADEVAAASDGVLAVDAGDLITVTYFDEDDGQGRQRIEAHTAIVDCAAAAIQDLEVQMLTATRAEITWTTDKPADSRVEFGPTPALGSVAEDAALTTSHRLVVSAFEACDRAYFDVSSTSASGELTHADAGGAPFEFNLKRIGGVLFHDNFETDAGWFKPGEWERAEAQGLGSGSADPTRGYSGTWVLGNDLTGTGAFAGDYEPDAGDYIRSPLIDASDATDLELIFRRKLGVTASDEAGVHVFAPSLQQVWASGGALDDDDWVEVRYDISALADLQPNLRLGFSIESVDPGQSYGWNIDEVIVKDSTQPDYLVCGGCAGSPSFAGATAAFDPDPCADTGLTLRWGTPPAWGTGTGGTFDVHRGSAPDFVPDGNNRIVSGLTVNEWTDAGAPVDTEVWYVVRARNNESCTGSEGLADANLVRRSSVNTVSQPTPGGIGPSLRLTTVGLAHVRLTWDAAPDAAGYVVQRDTTREMSTPQPVGSTPGLLFEDVGVATDGNLYYYRIVPVSTCGL